MNYSIVLKDGAEGFACFTKGQNSFFVNDPTQPLGYTDSFLADYLIHQAQQFALPWLLQQMTSAPSRLRTYDIVEPVTKNRLRVLELVDSELSLIINATSHKPYKIRSWENHPTFGKSTNDLLLSNYSKVSFDDNSALSLQLPYRLQTVYNSSTVLEDVKLDSIAINPAIKAGFFDPVLSAEDKSSPQAPKQGTLYPRAEVHEFFEAGLWGGPFESFFNTSDVVVTHPIPNIPQIMAVYVGYADYVQLVLNFTDGVLITDAAPHRSRILIQWVKETLGKSVTHIVPSHHHRDHAGGVPDYVDAGAVLVVPDVAKKFYSAINGGNVSFSTYNESNPFILKDANIQFRSLWRDENPHARDWSYGIATSACPTNNEGTVAFVADVWSPDPNDGGMGDAVRFDIEYARQWLDTAVEDGLPRGTIVVGAHGGNTTTDKLESLIAITGYEYPALEIKDWKAGGALCRAH
jgi:glyoxylase-like metal-dependent hydrolase (beta-lactamase superfamily II)